jgi:hypothetical protein
MILSLRLVSTALGVVLVCFTLLSSVRTLILPRSAPDLITFFVFRTVRWLFNLRMRWASTYEARDHIMALYAPIALLALVPTWLVLVLLGYMGIYWGLGINDPLRDFMLSGSSLFTLGFASGDSFVHTIVAFSEACIGLILVALLIAYLPTMYSIFSQREAAVTQLATRAGSPPSVSEFLLRHHRIGKLGDLPTYWRDWEILFSIIEESHTSLPALVFFRSPQPSHSWITATGAVMDAAAFIQSSVDVPQNAEAALCIRAGFIALRRICTFFGLSYHVDPRYPEQTVSVTREEYDAVCAELEKAGVPLRSDREEAWRNFAGWRVNYDDTLLAICALVMAPYAPWSSDRSPRLHLPSFKDRLRSMGL